MEIALSAMIACMSESRGFRKRKQAGREGGVLENCTQGLTLSDGHTYLAPRKCLIYSIELFKKHKKAFRGP